jgi:hypothetical protein
MLTTGGDRAVHHRIDGAEVRAGHSAGFCREESGRPRPPHRPLPARPWARWRSPCPSFGFASWPSRRLIPPGLEQGRADLAGYPAGVDLPLQGRLALLQVLHPLPVARHDGWPAIRGVAEQRPAASCGAAGTEVRGLEVSRPGRGGCRSGSFRHAMQPNWAHAMCRTPSYQGVSSVALRPVSVLLLERLYRWAGLGMQRRGRRHRR